MKRRSWCPGFGRRNCEAAVSVGNGVAARVGGRERLPTASDGARAYALRRGVAAIQRAAPAGGICTGEVLLKTPAAPRRGGDASSYFTGEWGFGLNRAVSQAISVRHKARYGTTVCIQSDLY